MVHTSEDFNKSNKVLQAVGVLLSDKFCECFIFLLLQKIENIKINNIGLEFNDFLSICLLLSHKDESINGLKTDSSFRKTLLNWIGNNAFIRISLQRNVYLFLASIEQEMFETLFA